VIEATPHAGGPHPQPNGEKLVAEDVDVFYGSFQAIKHKLADLLLEVELAKSAAYYAAQAAAVDDPEWPALACLAKAAASETYLRMAAECIQLHGGIGFTWDNDTHLWFKRAKSSEVFLGQPSYHRELLMQRWGV